MPSKTKQNACVDICLSRYAFVLSVINTGSAFLAGFYMDSITVSVTENEMRVHTLSAWLHNRMPG